MNSTSGSAAPASLQLLGTPLLHADGHTATFVAERRFQLLAILALNSGDWVARDRLAALLWPEHDSADARRNLRKVIFRAHELPGTAALEASDHALRWHIATDTQAFSSALRDQRIADAVDLYRGPLLAGVDDPANTAFADWLAAERARWAALWRQAVLARLGAIEDAPARMALAQRLLAEDPLDESAVAALIGAELALGRGADARRRYRDYAARLADELGVEPSNALRDLLRDASPAGPSVPAVAGSAAPTAGFVGRRQELAELRALLARPECRLLTIIGPGGIGKSRMAREVLGQVARDFPGGAHWVELQDLSDRAAVIARLAQTLGIDTDDSRDPLQSLLRQLPRAATLLVFDNAEHLGELPQLAAQLAAADAPLKLLLTSRARLGAEPEWLLPLAGLAVPDDDSRDLEAAAAFDAVRLFCERAHGAQRDFYLARHLPAVIGIVEAVQGMPLAIELAAAWVRLLPPAEIARELTSSIDVLERDPSNLAAPARPEHASLRAVLDRSWRLLAPRERQALAALSVFHGGFTRAAAQAVAQVSLPLLASLADKSLLTVDPAGRFGMHPVVAVFAAERLAESGARADELRRRHAQFFAAALHALAPHARADPRPLIESATADFANYRAAWRHAVAAARADLLAAMAIAWTAFHESRGRFVEGIEQLRPALELPPAGDDALRALVRIRHGLSTLLHRKGDLAEAQATAQGTLESAQSCGEAGALIGCLCNIGLCLWNSGRPADAMPPLERALALAREHGDRHGIATALANLAIAEKALGNYALAHAHQADALQIHRELGDQRGIAARLNNIGNLYRAQHQWEEARLRFTEGLAVCRQHDLTAAATMLRLNLGLTEMELGLMESAREHLHAVLAILRDSGQLQTQLAAELGLARAEIALRDPAPALARLRRVVDLARAKSFNTHPVVAAAIYGELLAGRGQLIEAARVWLMASVHPHFDAMDRQGALTLLDRLSLNESQLAAAKRDVPSLDDVLARMFAAHPSIDTAAG